MHTVGMVLHPERDSAEAVDAVLDWATKRSIQVLGINAEIKRLRCAATAVSAEELGRRSDLIVSLGGDGTMLRAMRLADQQRAPVLGVNLGKLGFLADIDVPELPEALSLVDSHEYMIEPRLAVDAVEDMFRLPDLTHVVIVAGDSDYIALAQRCKRLGRYVVGIEPLEPRFDAASEGAPIEELPESIGRGGETAGDPDSRLG